MRPVSGALALVAAVREARIAEAILPLSNVPEAALLTGVTVRGAQSLGDVVAHLAGVRPLPDAVPTPAPSRPSLPEECPDLADVASQSAARRALEIAVAGRHSLALCGPPGVGKTLLLRAAAGLLPPLEDDEAIEVSRIYSIAGLLDRRAPLVRRRPFRAPHHTTSTQALVGGGPRVRPGEASLAHRGVLLLDETLQFRTDALDALRQPLESGAISIARVDGAVTLPARFLLLMAFNPCPCGWLGTRTEPCRCEGSAARRYAGRLSGPLRDRIDLYPPLEEPSRIRFPLDGAEPSASVAIRIAAAWQRQRERQGRANAELPLGDLDEARGFSAPLLNLLQHRGRRFHLSPRRLDRTARVARTIADLEGCERVEGEHVDEALAYRPGAEQ